LNLERQRDESKEREGQLVGLIANLHDNVIKPA